MSETPYQQVLIEWKALSRILGRNKNDLATTRILASRLWAISRTIKKHIIDERSTALPKAEARKISETREVFLNDIQCSFSENNTCFMYLLHEFSLTEWETRYCILETVGFTGGEIGMMIQLSYHYAYSSRIRKKFLLNPHDTNIGNHLRSLLEKSISNLDDSLCPM